MAGARERLSDRRGSGAALGADGERVRRLCDPHFGVGSDGVLLLLPTEDPGSVAELRIFNPDGSEAELSGNGAREAVLYLRRSGWTEEDEFTILTKAGPIRPTIVSERECTLEMGRARTRSADFPIGPADGRGELEAAGRELELPARLDRQPAVRDRGRGRARIARSGHDRARRSSDTRCSRTAPTSPSCGWRGAASQRVAGADLRARRGGDALLGHRRVRRRRGGLPGRRTQPAHGASSTAGSWRSRSARALMCASPAGPSRSSGRALAGAAARAGARGLRAGSLRARRWH